MEITSLNSKLIQKCLQLHAKQVAHSLLGVFGGIRKVIQNRASTKEDCSGQENYRDNNLVRKNLEKDFCFKWLRKMQFLKNYREILHKNMWYKKNIFKNI